MPTSADTYTALADVSAAFTPPPATGLSDNDLMDTQRSLAEIRRRVDAAAAVITAEIALRSRRELGYSGLAQRFGARTPELLVQHLTGFTAREAQSLVRVGALMAASPSADPDAPVPPTWLRDVAAAVVTGQLSIDAADAIRSGLGEPDSPDSADGAPDGAVTAAALADAAATLLREAAGLTTGALTTGTALTVERLAARARDLRNELDLARVQQRENDLRERRYLHLTPQSDGMTRLTGLLDPESAALVTSAFDAATSPRRGGPRFVDAAARDRAEELLRDERTTEQIAVDAFTELIRLGGAADSTAIIGGRRPAVRILIADRDLRARRGLARLEGQSTAVSIETAERHICEAGTVPVLFDGKQVVDLGREQRLYSDRQRIGLAARDGGCRFPGCARPPSWCEAHHINEWARDNGRTDLADGVLLCRYHHLLVHNNGWRVTREQDEYFVVPPPTQDPAQRPIPAPGKSAALRRLVETG
ncbi:MAG: DUF222 domain-containing protein [Pseudolysinimonas sp.]